MTTEATIEPPATPRYCPFCRSATEGRRFCPGCGHYVLTDLATPHEAASNGDAPVLTEEGAPPGAGSRSIVLAGPVLLVAGVLAILGTFQSWLTIPPYVSFLGSAEDEMTWRGIDGVRYGWSIDLGAEGAVTIAVGLCLALFGIALLLWRGSSVAIRIGALVCVAVLASVVEDGMRRVDGWNFTPPGYEVNPRAVVGMGIPMIAWAAALGFIGVFIPTWRGIRRRSRSRGQ